MGAAQNLVREMEKLLPPVTVRFLRAAGVIAAREGLPLFLVGGSVRDLLLGRPILDLDLVAEGDAPLLASVLAKELGGEVTARSQFGTAKLKTADLNLDLASARRESYAHPGALPTVRPGDLEDDLVRRDFTINAMAVGLAEEGFGELRDPFQGRRDLDARLIRALHSNSFVDDATRILRALRYEVRLGFCMDTETEARARRDAHYLDTISGDRVRHDLERLFQEPRPEAALDRARQLDILPAILLPLQWPGEVHQAVCRFREGGGSAEPLLFTALLASTLTSEAGEAFVHRLNMPARWRRVAQHTIDLGERLSDLATEELRPSQVYGLLNGMEVQAVQAWSILPQGDPVRARLKDFLEHLRHVKPALNGHDLLDLGVPSGPEVGRIMEGLRTARLDGALSQRQDEEAWVRRELVRRG